MSSSPSFLKTIDFSYLTGSNNINSVKLPNGVLKSIEFEPLRDLPVRITHSLGDMLLLDRTQTFDALARPAVRTGRRVLTSGSALAGPQNELAESFGYTLRGELESAVVNGREYAFFHDNIGNREGALGEGSMSLYATNRLNQYDSISRSPDSPFLPEYDADGNQTALRTSTGDWRVEYDANNRPVRFSQPGTEVYCEYDARGRRCFARRVVRDGQTVSHLRYLYRGYLQIAALDLLNDGKLVYTLLWDPTEEAATRPVAMVRNGEVYYYSHDFNKNVTELLDDQGEIRATYEYESFGVVGIRDPEALGNSVQWSSEMHDEELGLVYYNYRHYNPLDGRWISRDFVEETKNDYSFIRNSVGYDIDLLGLLSQKESEELAKERNRQNQANREANKQSKAHNKVIDNMTSRNQKSTQTANSVVGVAEMVTNGVTAANGYDKDEVLSQCRQICRKHVIENSIKGTSCCLCSYNTHVYSIAGSAALFMNHTLYQVAIRPCEACGVKGAGKQSKILHKEKGDIIKVKNIYTGEYLPYCDDINISSY